MALTAAGSSGDGKKVAEARQKEAQQQYNQWMDTWKDIQKSIETPARDISEILNDIAQYGTPAMSQQVDRVTYLLRQLGSTLEDINRGSPSGSSGGDQEVSTWEIIEMMKANSEAWHQTTDADERRRLHEENERLGAMIGASYDAASGEWDYSNVDYRDWDSDLVWGVSAYSGQGIQLPSLYAIQNDGYAEYKARNNIYTTDDLAARSYSITPGASTTSYVDDHSQNYYVNGVKLGSDMAQRSMVDVFNLRSR